MVRKLSSQAQAPGLRANTPRLALPVLSPERLPTTAPRGAAIISPVGTSAAGASTGVTVTSPGGATESTTVRSPPRTTTCWGTSSAGTRAGQWTPKGRAPPPPPMPNMPGMVARPNSLTALKTTRPTLRSSGSLRLIRHRATASSLVAGSALSVRTTRVVTSAKSSGAWGQANQKASSTSSALASTSSPVRATDRSLRKPPRRFIDTLRVDGGGSPRVPEIDTRSGPTWSRSMVSKRAVTSGPR